MKIKLVASALILSALTGCNSFKVMQSNSFIDEDGNLIIVRYGQLAKPHKTQFVSPVNGKTLDMQSKLRKWVCIFKHLETLIMCLIKDLLIRFVLGLCKRWTELCSRPVEVRCMN